MYVELVAPLIIVLFKYHLKVNPGSLFAVITKGPLQSVVVGDVITARVLFKEVSVIIFEVTLQLADALLIIHVYMPGVVALYVAVVAPAILALFNCH